MLSILYEEQQKDLAKYYLVGYVNEVGESFRAKIGPKWVLASYGVSTAYVVADTIDKSVKAHNVCICVFWI